MKHFGPNSTIFLKSKSIEVILYGFIVKFGLSDTRKLPRCSTGLSVNFQVIDCGRRVHCKKGKGSPELDKESSGMLPKADMNPNVR